MAWNHSAIAGRGGGFVNGMEQRHFNYLCAISVLIFTSCPIPDCLFPGGERHPSVWPPTMDHHSLLRIPGQGQSGKWSTASILYISIGTGTKACFGWRGQLIGS